MSGCTDVSTHVHPFLPPLALVHIPGKIDCPARIICPRHPPPSLLSISTLPFEPYQFPQTTPFCLSCRDTLCPSLFTLPSYPHCLPAINQFYLERQGSGKHFVQIPKCHVNLESKRRFMWQVAMHIRSPWELPVKSLLFSIKRHITVPAGCVPSTMKLPFPSVQLELASSKEFLWCATLQSHSICPLDT